MPEINVRAAAGPGAWNEALEKTKKLRADVTETANDTHARSRVISDYERSDGLSFRVRANAISRRVRVDLGFAESQFTNPADSLLSQGRDLVPVRETRNKARYIDADVDLLRNLSLGGSATARLTLGYRHERVDPLYRTVGTYVRSDQLNDRIDLRADIAWLTLSGSLGRGGDNLDDVPSVLTTQTDRSGFTAALPLQRASEWLPSLDYRLDRTHQAGLGIPTGGGFSESHIPDQVNLNHTARATWQLNKVRVGLGLNLADQDNRQPGRENADFLTRRTSLQLGVNPAPSLDLGVDLALETLDNKAEESVVQTQRWGVQASWQPLRGSSLSVSYSDTFQDNDAATFERGDRTATVGWNSVVPFVGSFGGQYFLRFNHQTSRTHDFVRDFGADRMFWTMQVGLSLSAGSR